MNLSRLAAALALAVFLVPAVSAAVRGGPRESNAGDRSSSPQPLQDDTASASDRPGRETRGDETRDSTGNSMPGHLPAGLVPNNARWDYTALEHDARFTGHLAAENPRHAMLEDWAGGDSTSTGTRTLTARAMAFAACYQESGDLMYWRGYQVMMGLNIVAYAAPNDPARQQQALVSYGVARTVAELTGDPEFAGDARAIIQATCRLPGIADCGITVVPAGLTPAEPTSDDTAGGRHGP